MKFRLWTILSVAVWLLANAPAPAAYTYVLSGVTNGESIPSGTIRTVSLFLHYDPTAGGATPVNNFAPGSNGLFSANSGVRYTPASGVTLTPGAVVPNAGQFDTALARNTTSETGFTPLTGFILQNNNPTPPGAISTVADPNNLLLFSFPVTFTNSGTSPQTITLRSNRLDPTATDNVLTYTLQSLDVGPAAGGAGPTLPGDINLTITVVPEPTSMALMGMAAFGFAGSVWRKRRQAKAAAVEAPAPV